MNRTVFTWLRQRLPVRAEPRSTLSTPIRFGAAGLDSALSGGLSRAALHEIYAPRGADAAAAGGFAAAVAKRAAERRSVIWAVQDFLESETGALHAPGLAELGLDPACFIVVKAKSGLDVLRAGAEAARCSALGAVVIALWGDCRAYDLTATRRLSLAASTSGVPIFALRIAAEPRPSAATTRWSVEAALSRAREARAPGDPRFALTLLRHRGGVEPGQGSGKWPGKWPGKWFLEWSRDAASFIDVEPAFGGCEPRSTPLSGAVVSLPADRPAVAGSARAGGVARAG